MKQFLQVHHHGKVKRTIPLCSLTNKIKDLGFPYPLSYGYHLGILKAIFQRLTDAFILRYRRLQDIQMGGKADYVFLFFLVTLKNFFPAAVSVISALWFIFPFLTAELEGATYIF